MYLWFSFAMFISGGIMALLIRAELFEPGLQVVRPELFNQLTTLHGIVMIFGAIMPAFVGFANWMLPLQLGAPDMAFARRTTGHSGCSRQLQFCSLARSSCRAGLLQAAGRSTRLCPSRQAWAWT